MRFSAVVLAYFAMGAMVTVAGPVDYQEAGVPTALVPDKGDFTAAGGLVDRVQNQGDVISGGAALFGAGLLVAFNLIFGLLGFMVWPLTTLHAAGAPFSVTLVGGGLVTMGFFVSVIRLLRGSA